MWVPGTTSAILGHEREAVNIIFDIVKRAYTNLPGELKPEVKTDTKKMYQFTHRFDGLPLDSAIYVALKLRSGTVQNLHITESAYIKDRNELNAGSKQAVPITGRITEETTGNGYNEFFDFYTDSDQTPNPSPLDYRTYFYAWFENSEYQLPGEISEYTKDELKIKQDFPIITDQQLLWRRWKMKELRMDSVGVGLSGTQLFKQEYPSTKAEAFQSGAGNVFDGAMIDAVKPANLLLGAAPELVKLGFKIWKDVKKKDEKGEAHEYVVGVDPSGGDGSDFADIDIWDKDTLEQVAQYYGKVRPDELAEITKIAAVYYNEAFVGVENNMLSAILFLIKIYDNYFFTTKIDERTRKRTKKVGWNTNTKTRDVMIDDFIIAFEDKEAQIKINSTITLKEMKTFVKKDNGKREHADGKHDDSLIAGMIALQMRKHWKPKLRTWASKPTGF